MSAASAFQHGRQLQQQITQRRHRGQEAQQQQPAAMVSCSLRRSSKHTFATRPASSSPPQPSGLRLVRSADAAPAAASSGGGGSWMDQPESQPPPPPAQVFPRLRERDPYRRLGVTQDASYEEVQEARNYLVEQYAGHDPSREAIELALDDILQERMKVRHRDGFRPPQRGKRTDVAGDAERVSLWQRVRQNFEPSVAGPTLVNDGSVFVALGLWAAWTATASDPTLALGAALAFCAWRLYDKRNKRNPDGPFWGSSPIWGALGATVAALVLGSLASYVLVNVVTMPPRIPSEALGFFVITLTLGFTAIFLK